MLLSPDLHSTPTTAQIFTCLFRQEGSSAGWREQWCRIGFAPTIADPRALCEAAGDSCPLTRGRFPNPQLGKRSRHRSGPGVTTWHFWSTSFFSATRYRWLFSIYLFFLVWKKAISTDARTLPVPFSQTCVLKANRKCVHPHK